MDNQKNKWVTPKEIIGISELLTEYESIKKFVKELSYTNSPQLALDKIEGYCTYINKTKLTPELVEKLFEGFERGETKSDTVKLFSDSVTIRFVALVFPKKRTRVIVKLNHKMGFTKIQTLADLARLTTAKPILLA